MEIQAFFLGFFVLAWIYLRLFGAERRRARSEVHLRLHDEREQLRLFRRDPGLPDLGSSAAMDGTRMADHRRSGRR
jgi:hypothetical protein